MRIGYMRYSQFLEFDFIKSSARMLGTELRLGIVEALIQLGHQVYILSPIGRNHLEILDGEGVYYDYSIFKNLKYSPDKLPKKLDIIIIEASTTNVMFGGKSILRVRDILKEYEGKVVYYHHSDRETLFPLGAIYDGEGSNFKNVSNLHEMNYKRMFKGVPFDNKEWILWTPGFPDLVIQRCDNARGRYSLFNKSIQVHIGYSKQFDRIPKKRNKLFSERKFDLIYIGKQKTNPRTSNIIKLYGLEDCKLCKTALIGNWKIDLPNCHNFGFIPGFGNLYYKGLYCDAQSAIVTSDNFFLSTGMMTTRVVQGIRSGNLIFVDGNYLGAENYVHYPMIIKNHKDIHKFLNLSDDKKEKIVQIQNDKLKPWYNVMGEVFQKI